MVVDWIGWRRTVREEEEGEDAEQDSEDALGENEPLGTHTHRQHISHPPHTQEEGDLSHAYTYHFHPESPLASTPLNANANTPLTTTLKFPPIVTSTILTASSSGRYQ